MGKRALLAQGLEAIYGDTNKFILYCEALEHAFVATPPESQIIILPRNSADMHCNFPAQFCPFFSTGIMMLYEHKS
jgi:hypothetical protein